jgi:hypothetical protein
MKKFKILCGIAVIVIAVVAAFNVSIDNQKEILSSVALENVEALAQELGNGYIINPNCPNGCVTAEIWRSCYCYGPKFGQREATDYWN